MSSETLERLTRAVADRYRVERELGSGGMATVYLAHDLKHNRQVAIKVMKPEVAAAIGVERFLREIEIAASLSSPHIVPLFDSGAVDGIVFYVMPYISGESLRDRLRREKQLPVDDAIRITQQVARALSHAGARGIVHRDIKPENILLLDGDALVADFGIARAIAESDAQSLTRTGVAVGTPAYASPEQASGERDLDVRTDVYALACVLYEMLAGQPPYTGPTAHSIVAQHMTAAAPEVRRMRALVPEHVERAIVRALSKVRADRFSTAQEFSAALEGADTTPVPDGSTGHMPSRAILRRAVGVAAVLLSVLLLNIGGLRDRLTRSGASAADDNRRSVAVLPFQNVGAPDEEYFSDGLTEELIGVLSQLRSLRVAARTSAFAFKGEARDVRDIARALSVSSVLTGSVRKAENRVRVTAQLVDASTGLDIWSETYEERDLSDIFDIQADVARRIARALETNLSVADSVRLARKPTENLEAYTLYLKGRYFWGRRGERLTTAIDYFNRAIAIDSQYARAYAGLASAYAPLGLHGYMRPQEAREHAKRAALRAVELDDNLPEAHTALGAFYHAYEWNWTAAEREFRRAIELDPNFSQAHLWYGWFLEAMSRFDEAVAERGRARELDPLSATSSSGFGTALLLAGRTSVAEQMYREALELDPDYWQASEGLGQLFGSTGRLNEARRQYELAVSIAGATLRPKARLAGVLAVLQPSEAHRLLREILAAADSTGIRHPVIATALMATGDTSAAIAWLETSYRDRHPELIRINVDHSYDGMRQHPQFRDVLQRIGLRP